MEDIAPVEETSDEFISEGTACYYDPTTGIRTCE
jgi:hypothetical protein